MGPADYRKSVRAAVRHYLASLKREVRSVQVELQHYSPDVRRPGEERCAFPLADNFTVEIDIVGGEAFFAKGQQRVDVEQLLDAHWGDAAFMADTLRTLRAAITLVGGYADAVEAHWRVYIAKPEVAAALHEIQAAVAEAALSKAAGEGAKDEP